MLRKSFIPILCGLFLLTAMQTNAQGDSWQNATLLTNGQKLNASMNSAGVVEHWYKITLTGNAAVQFILQTDSVLFINTLELYPADGNTIGPRRNSTGCNYYADFKINDLSAGTYYLKIQRYINYGTYSLSYKATPPALPNDPEPNDFWYQAVALENNSTVTGQLGFWHMSDNSTTGDVDWLDWYKITLDGNAAVQFILQTDSVLFVNSIELYPANSDTIGPRRNSTGCNYYADFKINDLSAGTYYLKIQRYTNYGTYKLSYKATPPALSNDPEPNDFWYQAVALENNSTVTGQLGFWHMSDNSTTGDVDWLDWYKITLDGNAAVQFILQTDSVLFVNSLELYPANGDTIGPRRNSTGCNYYADFKINDLSAGTYYLKIQRYTNYGTYKLSYKATPPALPNDPEPNDFWYQAVALENNSTVTGQLGFWHMSDNSTTGDVDWLDWYKITLDGNAAVQFILQTDSVLFVNSLELYPANGDTIGPRRNSTGCNYYADFKINDLTAGTYYLKIQRYINYGTYMLKFNVIPGPTAKFSYIQNLNTVNFVNESLYADSLKWDFGDGTTNILNYRNPNHMYSEPGYYPVQLIAFNVVSSDTMIHHISVRGIQRVESNRGGTGGKVTFSVIGGGMKAGAQVKLRRGATQIAALETHTPNLGKVDATFNLTGVALGLYDVVVQNPGETEMSLANAFTVEETILPDVWSDVQGNYRTLRGRWQTYQIVYGNTGNIDAQSVILWIVTPDSPAEVDFLDLDFDYPAPYPNTYSWLKTDVTPYVTFEDYYGDGRDIRLYGVMLPSVAANSESAFNVRVKSDENFILSVFQTESFVDDDENQTMRMMSADEYGSFGECMAWAFGKWAADKAFGILTEQIPGAACAKDLIKNTYSITDDYVNNKSSVSNIFWSVGTTAWSCASDFIGPIKAAKMAKAVVDAIIDMADRYDANKECLKYKKKNEKDKRVAAVNSFDPNEMIGPTGFGAENYVAQRIFPYTVLFENKSTATAAAQEVVIVDTLDTQKFDLSTFRFKEFGFGEKRYTVFQDSNKFVNNIDLRPGKNAILRVTGVLENNVVTWRFFTLDPRTMDLTEDIEAGFLPPNINSPQGEGFVSFVVNLKETVGNGAVINNFADIFFDVNEPIRTNVFSNKIDEIAPVSQVVSANYNASTHEIELAFSGTDPGGAGIKSYELYVSTNGGDFVQMFKNISGDSFSYTPLNIGAYSFYSIAVDSLSYREKDKSSGEASIIYTGIKPVETAVLQVYPNPVKEELYVKSETPIKKIEISDLTGRMVEVWRSTSPQNAAATIHVSAFTQGVYMLRIYTDNGVIVKKVVKE